MGKGKWVILDIGEGSFEEGFPVNLEIGEDGVGKSDRTPNGFLPAAPKVWEQFQSWWEIYQERVEYFQRGGKKRNTRSIQPISQSPSAGINFAENAGTLQKAIDNWLNSSDESWLKIRDSIFATLNPHDEIKFIIQTENVWLRRLPWQAWQALTTHLPKTAFAFAPPHQKLVKPTAPKSPQINILAIFGNTLNINYQPDRKALEGLGGKKVDYLVKPTFRQLIDKLQEKHWQIVFFAGHSNSEEDASRGYLELNKTDTIPIDKLKESFKEAIRNGLQLAIFNSCDGLGLAKQLEDLHLPQIIVMREIIPDEVAQDFLRYFFRAFVKGKGNRSLHDAVRQARNQLDERWRDTYPNIGWLPAISQQHPQAKPLTWTDLQGYPLTHRVISTLTTSILMTALVLLIRALGILQGGELLAYDKMMRLRPDESIDERLVVITIDKEDFRYQSERGMERQQPPHAPSSSLADVALGQLLDIMKPLQPRAIGLDIYRDFKAQGDLASKLENTDNFIAVCKHGDSFRNYKEGMAKPPEVPEARIGFADVIIDPDGVLRRHLWYYNSSGDSPCQTEISFSLQLASHYLAGEGIQPQANPEEEYLQLGKVRLTAMFPAARGYQILLNYRTRGNIAVTIPLRKVLEEDFDSDLIKDKVVIIGVTAKEPEDDFNTPFTTNPNLTMRGVFIQGQMTSQIISAALGERSLLSILPLWGEVIVIFSSALVGGVLAWCWFDFKYLLPAGVVAIAIFSGAYFIFFTQNLWLPLISSGLSLILTGGGVVAYRYISLNR